MRMRKKKHGSDRLTALSALHCAVGADGKAVLPEDGRPLCLEIGCGKGDFVCALSRRCPETNYIAVEKVTDVLVVAVEKYASERGLGKLAPNGGWLSPDGTVYKDGAVWNIPREERGNVRFLPGDAKLLPELFPDSVFDRIYVNFCDPWPKKGYADRRLTAPGFLKEYIRILKPGGTFCFKTDNEGLFEYSKETVAAAGFEIVFLTDDLHESERAADNIMTEYERNFSEKGVKIHALDGVSPKNDK